MSKMEKYQAHSKLLRAADRKSGNAGRTGLCYKTNVMISGQ